MTRTTGMLLLAGLTISLVGCGSKFKRENYEMITVDVDTKYDVRKMIGDPEFDLGDQWYYEDDDDYYAARVWFYEASDIVSGKQWYDMKAGTWEGRNPNAAVEPDGELRYERTRTRTIDD